MHRPIYVGISTLLDLELIKFFWPLPVENPAYVPDYNATI